MQRRMFVTRKVFFPFFGYCIYRYGLSEHKFFLCKGQLIFSGNQEKKSCRIFLCWNFKGVTQGSPDLSRIFEGKVTKLNFCLDFLRSRTRVVKTKIIYSFL